MAWNLTGLYRRRFLQPAPRKPIRKAFRPALERLEDRLAPANVSVLSFHNDPAITGQNLQETVLTPANVNPTNFGKLASVAVDGYTYAQPLYVANLMVGGAPHNVAFVATEHDSLYAFDVVNDPAATTGVRITTLWQRSFINPAAGITSVPQPDIGSGDIVPEIGITGAPAIDPATNVLYLVAKTKEVRADGNHYVQKLYALDITSPTGADKTAPYTIGDSKGDGFNNQTTAIVVAGAGADTSGGANPMIAFNAFRENQRPSLQLLNGRVYVGWASHGDIGPYHGWVVGFNETTLQPEKWFNTTPNARASGIWQSEGAISTDGTYLYFAVGNAFNGPNPGFDPAHGNYSEAVMKLDPRPAGTALAVADYFVPFNWQALDNADADLGSGGVMLLPDSVGGNGTGTQHTHLMVETGKDGHIYLLDRDNMGGLGISSGTTPPFNINIVQDVVAGPGGVWGNPAFYQESATSGLIFYHGSGADSRAFRITNGQITQVAGNFIAYRSNQTFGFPGAQPVISANGANNPASAIAWELQVDNYGSQGPANLHAYALPAGSTGNMTELYNSNQTGLRDQLSASVKFTSAVVTNGLVFAAEGGGAAAGNPASGTFNVFGLFPTHAAAPAAPTNLSGMGTSPTSIQITWTGPSPNTATGIKVFRSTDGTTFTPITTVGASVTSYTDTGLSQSGTYYYKVAATNQAGDSAQTSAIQLTPLIAPPVLSTDNVSSNKVVLVWTRPAVANDHYNVERSTSSNFTTFTTIAMNVPGNQLSATDADPVLVSAPGQYFYRVRAFVNPAGNPSVLSNVVAVRVGPGSAVIDYSGGFPLPPAPVFDLQANGSAQFAETTARLTNAPNQAGSVFSVNEENILNWTTSFQVRLHEGSQPSYGNGFAFVIQAISSLALGQGGAGLGYQGTPESVAIKFETTTGAPENGTGGSTGLFYGGSQPTTPSKPGEVNLMLDASMVNLMSQSSKTITLSYAYNADNPGMSVLHETILDPDHGATPQFTHDYTVDLPTLLGIAANGNTIGYVGFTGSTGDNSHWELQDILNWRFAPTGPAAPHGLVAVAGGNFNDLSWKSTSADEEGFYVERSTNANSGFTRIATLGAGVTTYHDGGLTNPQQYYYRVQAFNHSGTGGALVVSGYSNVASAATVFINLPYGNDFSSHGDLTTNGSATFAGAPSPVGIFAAHQDIGTQGNPAPAGSATFDSATGAYTLTASGSDIWDTKDHFQYVYEPLVGNGEIVARLVSAVAQDFWTKAGVMIRADLSPESANDFMFEAPRADHEEPVFQWRDGFNQGSADTGNHMNHIQGTPVWLRLVRNGDTFTGYWAVDVSGAPGPWQQLGGPHTTTMPNSVFVGLVLTSHNNGAVATAVFDHVMVTAATAPLPLTVLRVTDGGFGEAGSSFRTVPIATAPFTTTFTFTSRPTDGAADSLNFVIQNDPGRTGALGGAGGGGGYAGITNSIAIKFDLYSGGTHTPTTGLYTGGASPGQAPGGSSIPLTGINLGSGDPLQVTLTYDGTALTETVRDTVTGAVFFHVYTLNLAQVIQSSRAFIGFTGGTGGETALQDVLNWTGTFQQAPAPVATSLVVSGFPSPVPAGAQGPVTVRIVDQFGDAFTGYRGTVHFTSSDSVAALPANYTFTAADNGAHTFSVTLNTPGTQSITATDTVTASLTGTQSGITVLQLGGLTIDFSGGFSNNSTLTANGDAFFTNTSSTVGTFAGHQDIGTLNNPTTAGNATFTSATGAYTLTASGSDIWDNADHFQYVYKPLVGDGEIVARIVSATAQDFWTKAGVMIRTDLGPHSANDFMLYTPSSDHQEPVFQWRDTFNGGSGDSRAGGIVPAQPMPIWLRLNRTGNVFTGSWANDNNGAPGTWHVITTHMTVMPTTVFVGLALTAHDANPPGNLATAVFDHVTVTGTTAPLQPAVARLTDGLFGEAGSIFTNTRVLDNVWTTTFVLKDTAVNGRADSLSFVMHNDPRGAKAVGGGGGAGGYSGIQNSIAIKFDLYTHGSHIPSTGLFINGQAPDSDLSRDIPLTPIVLANPGQAGNPIRVTLTYNGTTLTETVVDTVTGATFTHDYLVNIPQIIGGPVAYVGFTGGTGGETAIQDILSWTGQFPSTQPAATYFTVNTTQFPNLVTNGGFETGDYTGWTRSGDTSADSVITGTAGVTTVHSGTHAARLGPDNLVFLTQTLATTPGVNYTLSFWLSNPLGGPGTEWLVRVGGNTLMDVSNAPSFIYTNFTFTFTATGNGTDLQFGFKHPPDWFYLDDVSVTPTNATAGAPFQLTVTALDAGGHRVGYNGTVHFTSTDLQATLPDNYTFTADDNGQHTFMVTPRTAGLQVEIIRDTVNSLVSAFALVTVNPAAASTLVVSDFPSPTTAGAPGGILVTAKDAFGNIATGYRGTVHLSSLDPQAQLEGDHTFTAADNGTYAFGAILKTAGTWSITATDTMTSSITGAQTGIVVTPAAASTFVVTASPTALTAGDSTTITVTAYDPYGNVATGYGGTVHLTSSDGQAVLPADATLSNGTGTFSVILKTAGSPTVTATDTANSSLTGSTTVTVIPAVASYLVVAGFPSPALRMHAYDFTVTAYDAYGNVATGYTGVVTFSSDEDHADLPADYSFTAADAGVHTFSATFNRFGTFYLRARDRANPSLTGTQLGIVVVNQGDGGEG
jgi:hypothetical protein